MNLTELRAAADRRSGISYDTTALTEVLNEALFAISAERDWPWLDADWRFTTAARATYTSPFGWRSIATVALDGFLLPMVPIGQIDDDSDTRGWAARGTELTLSPTPAAGLAVVVRGVRNETALERDQDSTLMPDEWQQGALVNFAASIVLERVDELERAERCMDRYRDAKRRMIAQANNVKGPHRVRVRPGSVL